MRQSFKIRTVTLEDPDSKLFNAQQTLALREEELLRAQKAVEEANYMLMSVAEDCLKKQSLKLLFGELIYAPNYGLTFVCDSENSVSCIGVINNNEDYEKLN